MTKPERRMTNQTAMTKFEWRNGRSHSSFVIRISFCSAETLRAFMLLERTTAYGYHTATRIDAFAGGVGQEGPADLPPSDPGVLVQILQEDIYPAPTPGAAGARAILQDRRSRHGRAAGGLFGLASRAAAQEAAAPHDAVPGTQTPGKKGGLEGLLCSVFTDAH